MFHADLFTILKRRGVDIKTYIGRFLQEADRVFTQAVVERCLSKFKFIQKAGESVSTDLQNQLLDRMRDTTLDRDARFYRIALCSTAELHFREPTIELQERVSFDGIEANTVGGGNYDNNSLVFLSAIFNRTIDLDRKTLHHEPLHTGNGAIQTGIAGHRPPGYYIFSLGQLFFYGRNIKTEMEKGGHYKPEHLAPVKPIFNNIMRGFKRLDSIFANLALQAQRSMSQLAELRQFLNVLKKVKVRTQTWPADYLRCDARGCAPDFAKFQDGVYGFFPEITRPEALLLHATKFIPVSKGQGFVEVKLELPSPLNNEIADLIGRYFLLKVKLWAYSDIHAEFTPKGLNFLEEIQANLLTELPFPILQEYFPELLAYTALFYETALYWYKFGKIKLSELIVGWDKDIAPDNIINGEDFGYNNTQSYWEDELYNSKSTIPDQQEETPSSTCLIKYNENFKEKMLRHMWGSAKEGGASAAQGFAVTLLDDSLAYYKIKPLLRTVLVRTLNLIITLARTTSYGMSLAFEAANYSLRSIGFSNTTVLTLNCAAITILNIVAYKTDPEFDVLSAINLLASSIAGSVLGCKGAHILSYQIGFRHTVFSARQKLVAKELCENEENKGIELSEL